MGKSIENNIKLQEAQAETQYYELLISFFFTSTSQFKQTKNNKNNIENVFLNGHKKII